MKTYIIRGEITFKTDFEYTLKAASREEADAMADEFANYDPWTGRPKLSEKASFVYYEITCQGRRDAEIENLSVDDIEEITES